MAVKRGDLVKVRVYGGGLVLRQVVEVHARGVLVCRPEEYALAEQEGREPVAVGFPVEDVLPEQAGGVGTPPPPTATPLSRKP